MLIGHDVQGGSMSASGRFSTEAGDIASVSIGGSLLGGAGGHSGEFISHGQLGAVKIGHNLQGGAGPISGYLETTTGNIASVTIGGSLIGGVGTDSGQVFVHDAIGALKIGRDLLGGAGQRAGFINSSGKIVSVSIGGSFLGGANLNSGGIVAVTDIGAVKIGHDFAGGSGQVSGFMTSGGKMASLSIGGSLIGGSNQGAGIIASSTDLGPVTIGHDLVGGSGLSSGELGSANGKVASVTIGGSLIGGTGSDSGLIISGHELGPVKIGHDLIGASISGMATLDGSGTIESLAGIVSVTIGGSIISGIDDSTKNQAAGDLTKNATIRATNEIGSLTVKGSLVGHRGANGDSPVIITARGQLVQGATTDLALGKVSIGGRVEFAQILAGYDTSLVAKNGDAQIGAVTVGGAWIASSIAAGAKAGPFGGFGIADTSIGAGSATITAKIASITIGGPVVGTPSPATGDNFGFVAQQIGSFHAGLFAAVLTAGTDAPIHLSLATADVTIHEV